MPRKPPEDLRLYWKPYSVSPWAPWPLDHGYWPSQNVLVHLPQRHGSADYMPIDGVRVSMYAAAVVKPGGSMILWSCDGKVTSEGIPNGT